MEYVTKITQKYENKNDFSHLLREVWGAVRFLCMEKMKLQREFFSFEEKKTNFSKLFLHFKTPDKGRCPRGER